MLKTSPFTVRFFCFIQSFDFYLFGYICSMNSIETLYAAFLKSTGISTDTRTLVKGNIFFALKGPAFNGNHLVNEALEKGALLAVADDENLKNYLNGRKQHFTYTVSVTDDKKNFYVELIK